MEYNEIYLKYQNAVKFRELAKDEKYRLLKEIFEQKLLNSISLSSNDQILPYLAGIKEVFEYVKNESQKVDFYRGELDSVFSKKKLVG
jgi:hypothetical protein